MSILSRVLRLIVVTLSCGGREGDMGWLGLVVEVERDGGVEEEFLSQEEEMLLADVAEFCAENV